MLNKYDVINKLNELEDKFGIKKESIVIVAGSALVFHGLRKECSDIDMFVSTEECLRLMKTGEFTNPVSRWPGNMRLSYEDFDIGNNTFPSVECGEYRVQSLESLLELKLSMNRAKDQQDISNLKFVLNVA